MPGRIRMDSTTRRLADLCHKHNAFLNRNFELPGDGWYQLAPLGEFPHGGAGINQIIDTDNPGITSVWSTPALRPP